jgi:glyoxylase-like metal-dependent hydrolase (beta-lactamase superfamily II)
MSLQYKIVPVTAFEQNCSILWCDQTKKAAVVDPGGDLPKILAELEALGLQLDKVILTHAHIDHAGATSDLAEQAGVPVIGPHKEDQFWIDMLPQQSQMFGFPAAKTFTPDRWLEQDDTVELGNEILEVLHCPGHTPGHVVFYHRGSHLLVVGDVLFQGSIGRTDFPKGDFDTLAKSIRSKLWALSDETKFIPGHGPMSTIGHEKATNPFVGGYG